MHRSLLLCSLLTACTGSAGPTGPKGDPGAAGEQGIQGPPGTAGKDGVTKIPHLVVVADGTDLGPVTPWGVYSEKIGGTVDYLSSVTVAYDQSNCKGNAVIPHNGIIPMPTEYFISPSLSIVHLKGTNINFATASFAQLSAGNLSCTDGAGPTTGFPFDDTGMTAKTYQRSELSVELR